MKDAPRCYAVRQLNPFLGALEVVETNGARALSTDGVNWRIEVEAARPEHTWGRDTPGHSTRQFFRFGRWSALHGLQQVPANPILDIGAMLAASEALIAILRSVADQLPFPFADRFEYWLLEPSGNPLALLATTVDARFIPRLRADRWIAETSAAGHSYARREDPAQRQADTTARQQVIHAAAGTVPQRRWLERLADGSGRPVADGSVGVPADAFPALPWKDRWSQPHQTLLFDQYRHQLAPQLLTLAGLPTGLRQELERAARKQAGRMNALHRLYPEVLQPKLLTAARVEARLKSGID